MSQPPTVATGTGPRCNPALDGLAAYRVPRSSTPVDLFLDGNEGAPEDPELIEALRGATPELVRSYPSARDLEDALSRMHNCRPEQVLVTAGADESLDRVCRAYLGPGRRLILPQPTFEMLERYARLSGGEVIPVPWPAGPYPVDAALSLMEDPCVVAMVSPNNPTGVTATVHDLERLACTQPGSLVLLDHAYVEYANVDLTARALAYPNVVVVRTLSKAWGLAGLRVGYVLGDESVIRVLRAAGGPYPVSALSLFLARARVADPEPMLAHTARVREERNRLQVHLKSLGADPTPSEANFVLARVDDPGWLRDGMAGMGIAVRVFPDSPVLGNHIRIACPGSEPAFARLEHALATMRKPQALLLDMDGVIADVSRSYREAILATAAGFGITLTAEDVRRAKQDGDANNDWRLTRRLLAAHGVDVPLVEVTRRFEALYQGSVDAPGLHHAESLLGSPETLFRLARRLPLAVVTGRPRADAERFLRVHGLENLFRTVVCLEDGPSKPDPEPVRIALRRLGVERAWMVGDTPDDMVAARGAAVLPLGVVAPGDDPQAMARSLVAAGAGRIIETLESVEELLA